MEDPAYQGPPSLIIGLCNPGMRYQETRHNAGAWLCQQLVEQFGQRFKDEGKCCGSVAQFKVQDHIIRVLLPTTYMNASGRAASGSSRYFKIPPKQVLIVHDELDLPIGTARFKFGGGHGGHNGLRDVIRALGTPAFARLRIGISKPQYGPVESYVLGRPASAERQKINASIDDALRVLPKYFDGDFEAAIRDLHAPGA